MLSMLIICVIALMASIYLVFYIGVRGAFFDYVGSKNALTGIPYYGTYKMFELSGHKVLGALHTTLMVLWTFMTVLLMVLCGYFSHISEVLLGSDSYAMTVPEQFEEAIASLSIMYVIMLFLFYINFIVMSIGLTRHLGKKWYMFPLMYLCTPFYLLYLINSGADYTKELPKKKKH